MQNFQFNNHHYLSLLWFIVLAGISIMIPRDFDYWWHLRSGQWMVENSEILRVDPFSYTMLGEPRIGYDWLADIGLYYFWESFGHIGVALLITFFSLLIFASVFLMLKGHIYIQLFAILPVLHTLISYALTPRPQIISLVFFAWIVFITYRYKRGLSSKWLLMMPFIFIIWANLHGGWSVAAIFMVLMTAGEILNNLFNSQSPCKMTWERLKWYFGACALSAGALFLTPFGLDLVLIPIESVFSLSTWNSHIREWHPTPILHQQGITLVLITILYAICVIYPAYRNKKQLDWSHLLIGLVMGYMAYRYRRSVVFFAIVAIPIIVEQLSIWFQNTAWGQRTYKPKPVATTPVGRAIKQLVLIITLLIFGGYGFWVLQPPQVDMHLRVLLPVDAVNIMKEEQLPERLFSHYNWGGYLLWEAPEYPVFIDGRTDLYRDFYFVWADTLRGKGWEATFAEWDIQTVLVYPKDEIAKILSAHPEWQTVYSDEMSILLTRKP